MRKLKSAGYRLYYLTNMASDMMDELRQREWFSLFDGGVAPAMSICSSLSRRSSPR